VTSMLLVRGMGQLLGVHLRGLELTAEPFALSAVFGPGMAVFAALAPARRAARRPLLPDLLGLQLQGVSTAAARMTPVGLCTGVVSTILVVALIQSWLPTIWQRNITAPLLGLVLASGVLLTPSIYPALARGVARLLGPLWGIEGRLAARQLERNDLRSG